MSHVALLLPDLEMGGAQRIMLLLARKFVERGQHVDLVLLSSKGPLFSNIPEGVKVVDLAARNFGFGQIGFLLSSVLRLANWMKQTNPDVLLSTITGTNIVALLTQKYSTVSTRIVIREAVTLKNISSVLRLQTMRWLYPQADAVIALSSIMQSELIEKVGVPSSNIHCITNPVDTEFIHRQAKSPIEHPWLGDKQIKIVISVGRLILQKDYATLLRAFALLPGELSARLLILGEGPERKMLEQLSKDLGITDVAQFVGFDANPWRWMVHADLFVLSSRWEGNPNALLEALVLNLPIVATEYDASVHDQLAPCGLRVVPIGNEAKLAQAIKTQLTIEPQLGYQLADKTEDIVTDYLKVLNCNDSLLSGAALDHETTTTTK